MRESSHANKFKGDRLKAIRKERNLKSIELARILGFTSPSPVLQMEREIYAPTDETEKKLCEYFEVGKNYFRD